MMLLTMIKQQLLLLKAESPLNKRFAAEFFKEIPSVAGVYYFRNSFGSLLYVGKAKNLRRRVSSYKQIKFGRSSKRLLRLVTETCIISWEVCGSEEEALLRENSLLRTFKPPFNRVNTWAENYVYLHVFKSGQDFLLTLDKELNPQAMRTFGAFKSKKILLPKLKSLMRLVNYIAMEPDEMLNLEPEAGDSEGYFFKVNNPFLENDLYSYLKGESEKLLMDAENRLKKLGHKDSFVEFTLQQDILIAREFYPTLTKNLNLIKMAGLRLPFIPKTSLDDLKVLEKSLLQ